MTAGHDAARHLPIWSRWLLAVLPLGDTRTEVVADFDELFADRCLRYGRGYAHWRLCGDVISLWRRAPRGTHMLQDVRFGFRLLRKHPVPVGVAVAGLGLAIGVVATVFSLVNATRLRPYGMEDPGTVVQVTRPIYEGRVLSSEWPYTRFLQMQAATSMVGVEALMSDTARIALRSGADGEADRPTAFVSGGYLRLLGAQPAMGRILGSDDDRPGATPVVVLSHRLWVTLGADREMVGRPVWINGAPAVVVGVLRPDFSAPGYRQPELWAPFQAFDDFLKVAETYLINGRVPDSMAGDPFAPTARTLVNVVARLRPDISMEVARQHLFALVNPPGDPAGQTAATRPIEVVLFRAARPIDGPDSAESWLEVASMLAVVGLVLAVGCANIGNLLLASASTRSREIGVRLALGASRGRLTRQLVIESLLISGASTIVGVLFSIWLSPIAARIVELDAGIVVTTGARVLLFAVGVALITGLAAGLAPARFGTRGRVVTALQSQSGAAGRPAASSRLRSTFIGLQAAVAMLLLVGAALLTRTALGFSGPDVGFDANRMLALTITAPSSGFDDRLFLARALDTMRALPGVEHAGLSELRPFGTSVRSLSLADGSDGFSVYINRVDAEFLHAAGVRLLHGRYFTQAEASADAPVGLITRGAAVRFFGTDQVVGRSLSELPAKNAQDAVTIVGVVADLALHRVHTEGFGTIFRPIARAVAAPPSSNPPALPTLIVRTANPVVMARQVEEALRPLDGRARPRSYIVQRDIDAFVDGTRRLAWIAGPLAGLALVLAVLGVYGVTSFVVHGRTQEVSVRLALGASSRDVRRLLVRDSLRPVAIGLAVGLAVALAAAKVFASLLPGVSPFDPSAIGSALLALGVAAYVAAALPSRAASRVDPATVLRQS